MAHYVAVIKMNDGYAFHSIENFRSVSQAGTGAMREIHLAEISCHHHVGIFAKPGEKHLHLYRSGILCLVENDEGVGKGATPHKGQGRNLDVAVGHALHHLIPRHHIVEGVVKGPQIRIHLLAQIAGKKPKLFSGFHRGPRQHHVIDLALHEAGNGGGHRKIGLARARGTQGKDQSAIAQGLQIGSLVLRTR